MNKMILAVLLIVAGLMLFGCCCCSTSGYDDYGYYDMLDVENLEDGVAADAPAASGVGAGPVD